MSEHVPASEQIADRAEQIYEERIRDTLSPEDKGKFVVIDTISGDYEVDEKDIVATTRLFKKHSDGSKFFHIRIGYRTAHQMLRLKLFTENQVTE